MGVEYKHYIRPESCSFRPEFSAVKTLLDKLAEERWIPKKDRKDWKPRFSWKCADGGAEVLYQFGIGEGFDGDNSDGLRYPFTSNKYPPGESYHTVELYWMTDYVNPSSECVDRLDRKDLACACGESLAYDLTAKDRKKRPAAHDARIRAACSMCARAFDPSNIPVLVRDGWSEDSREVPGGCAYRFALVIDCGKSIPTEDRAPTLERDLLSLTRAHLGVPIVEVGQVYT